MASIVPLAPIPGRSLSSLAEELLGEPLENIVEALRDGAEALDQLESLLLAITASTDLGHARRLAALGISAAQENSGYLLSMHTQCTEVLEGQGGA
jgi:hypothetical protein